MYFKDKNKKHFIKDMLKNDKLFCWNEIMKMRRFTKVLIFLLASRINVKYM